MLPLDGLLIVGLTAALYRAGPLLSTLMRLPSITVFLLAGVTCRLVGLLDTQILHTVMPLHQAALAMITFAAGAELDSRADQVEGPGRASTRERGSTAAGGGTVLDC